MKVYIVVYYPETTTNGMGLVESVWNTEELARSAIYYHALNRFQVEADFDTNKYGIIIRTINTTVLA